MKNFQRTGAISNAHVGRDFERRACNILEAHGILLKENYQVPCGLANNKKKLHKFDLGSEDPPTLVKCKSHT